MPLPPPVAESAASLDVVLGLYADVFQTDAGFAGCSDIAIGTVLCLGR
jgi:hypothetical protein